MKLSIIIPTYNCARYIEKALFSIYEQLETTSLDINVIVVDDGSTDNTFEVIKNFKRNKTNLRIEYYFKNNGNWGSAINYVITNRLIDGSDYVTILDADDHYLKKGFLKIQKYLDNKNDYIASNIIKRHKNFLSFVLVSHRRANSVYHEIGKQTPFCVCLGKFFKVDVFYKLPLLKEHVPYQDAILSANIIKLSKKLKYVRNFVGCYHYYREGNSMTKPWDRYRYQLEVDLLKELIDMNLQEIAAVHLMRTKFSKIVKKEKLKFTVDRKFVFNMVPYWDYFFWWFIFIFFLRKFFIIKRNKKRK